MCLLAVWNSSCWEDVSLESLDGCQVGYITSDGRSWNDPYLPAHLLSRDIYTSTPVCHTHDSPNLDIFQLYRPSTYISQCPQQQNTLVKWRIASTPVPAPSIYTVFTSRPSLYTPDEGVSRKPSASVHAPNASHTVHVTTQSQYKPSQPPKRQCQCHVCSHPPSTQGPQSSSLGILIQASIAALNAANPAHPTAAACGPPCLANIAPVKHPAAAPFAMSFLALSPSMPHSIPLNNAPTVPKFLAVLNERAPMSLKPMRTCCRQGREETGVVVAPAVWKGVSYAICCREGWGVSFGLGGGGGGGRGGEGGAYRGHEDAKEAAEAEAGDARHGGFGVARFHGVCELRVGKVSLYGFGRQDGGGHTHLTFGSLGLKPPPPPPPAAGPVPGKFMVIELNVAALISAAASGLGLVVVVVAGGDSRGVVGWSLSCAERLSRLGAKSLSRNMFLPPLTAKMFGVTLASP